MTKRQSRIQQWEAACSRAQDAIQELIDLQSEYQEWRDNLLENLENSPVAEKLDEVTGVDLEGLLSTIEEAAGLDLPRGFGND